MERSDQKKQIVVHGTVKYLSGINMLTQQEAFLTDRVANPWAVPFIPLDDLHEIIAEPPELLYLRSWTFKTCNPGYVQMYNRLTA